MRWHSFFLEKTLPTLVYPRADVNKRKQGEEKKNQHFNQLISPELRARLHSLALSYNKQRSQGVTFRREILSPPFSAAQEFFIFGLEGVPLSLHRLCDAAVLEDLF
jgi:hypothetical protein